MEDNYVDGPLADNASSGDNSKEDPFVRVRIRSYSRSWSVVVDNDGYQKQKQR